VGSSGACTSGLRLRIRRSRGYFLSPAPSHHQAVSRAGPGLLSRLVGGPPRLTIPRSAPRGQIGQSPEIVATLESRFRRQLQTQQSRRNPSQHFPLDSCNENLPEKRIHRNYASRPGGMPRRVFCCAHASRGQPMTSGARRHTRACQHRDADRRLQKRATIVSRLLFTMKIPTTACGVAVR